MYSTVWFIALILANGVISEDCITNGSAIICNLMSEINMSISDTRYVSENGTDEGECSDSQKPCKTLMYASFLNKSRYNITSLKIKICAGEYSLTNQKISFHESNNIVFEGSGVDNTIIRCGNTPPPNGTCIFENFAFHNSSNIWIRNITFDGCGPYPSAHYIASSSNVILENNVYQNGLTTAVILYLSSPVYVMNSHFNNNIVSTVSNKACLTGSNALFFRNNVTATGGISVFSENHTQNVVVLNCRFDNNFARNNTENNSVPSQLKQFGHGGGLSLRLVNSSDGLVCVANSSFINNTAEVGGGAISVTTVESHRNNITCSHVTFNKSLCFIDKCTGGAVKVDLFAPGKQNRINFFGCHFSNNSALNGSGGAISIASSDKGFSEDGRDAYKLVTIDSCSFKGNMAKFEGTAVGLFSLGRVNQAGFRIFMKDCLFEDNYSDSRDISALTTYRVLVEVDGYNNKYIRNIGGGITLLNTRVDVRGRIEFHENHAVFGGGFALSGRCLILLYKNSSMRFEGNRATGSGAAIFVVYPSSNFVLPILNRGCFIQYFDANISNDLPPDRWETTIEFVDNLADSGGSAIFTNDLNRCQWLNVSNATRKTYIFNPPKGTITPFNLTNNLRKNTPDTALRNLGTDPSNITAFLSKSSDYSFGETIEITVSTDDDVGNFRQAVWAINGGITSIDGIRSLSRDNTSFKFKIPGVVALQNDSIQATEKEGANITLRIDLFNAQGGQDEVTVRVKGSCHPGYYFDMEQQLCKCNIRDSDVIRCDGDGRYVYIKNGKWAYGGGDDDKLDARFTLPVFLQCKTEGESGLPGCLFKYDSPDEQCNDRREGDLCSQCKKGYGISLDLRRCVDSTCGAPGVIIFVLTCLCFVAFSFIALFFDLTLPNELRGFIFYAQVIGLIYRNSPYVTQSSTTIDILVNLLGFSLPIPVCFTEHIRPLYVALLGLVPPLLVTLVTVIYVLSARFVCVKALSNRTSIHGMVLLSLFVYKYVADTAFILLSCRQLTYKNESAPVFLYDTTQKCLGPPMVVFTVLAFLTVLLFVIPIPILVLVTSKRRFSIWILKQLSYFRDALNIGVKKELYWFTAWDIFRRIPFVVTVYLATFAPSSLILFIHCLIILIIVTVHCISKPYEKEYINMIEAAILGILFLSTVAILDEDDLYIGNFVSSTLLVTPFIYALIYLSIWPSKWIWNKQFKKYYRELQRVMKFHRNKKFTSVNTNGEISHEFLLVEPGDAKESEDHEQITYNMNYLREPLLDDLN